MYNYRTEPKPKKGGDCLKAYALKAERYRVGLTQRQVGEELGITENSYQMKESGKSPFTVKEIVLLSKLYCMTYEKVNDIFFDNQLPIGNSSLPSTPA